MVSTAGHESAREITMGFQSIPLTTRARRPDGADDRTPDDEVGKGFFFFAVDGRCLVILLEPGKPTA